MTIPTNPIRKSVPTPDIERWWACGWAYVKPDFDIPNHSVLEWLSDKAPVEPENRVPDLQPENVQNGNANA